MDLQNSVVVSFFFFFFLKLQDNGVSFCDSGGVSVLLIKYVGNGNQCFIPRPLNTVLPL